MSVSMDPEAAPATGYVRPIDINKRKSSARRKSSAVPTDIPTDILQAENLSDADRRLAEMGYTQVGQAVFSCGLRLWEEERLGRNRRK